MLFMNNEEENIDFTKCSICNGFFRHIILRDIKNNIVKHITGCYVCLRLIERKERFEAKILEIDYMLFVRKDENRDF